MTLPTLYLAGPITGLDYKGATEWRDGVREEMLRYGIDARSPMRGKSFLAALREIGGTAREWYTKNALASAPGVVCRDRNDVRTAGAVLMNLAGATRVSIGSMCELGWADAFRVPVITVMEPGNIHDHMFVTQLSGYVVPALPEALDIARVVLTGAPR